MTSALPRPNLASLRIEDLALAATNLVVPVVAGAGAGTIAAASDGAAPFLGLAELLAIVGVIAAIATRSPGGGSIAPDGLHGWLFAGPLLGAVGIIGSDATRHVGLDIGGILGIAFFVAVVAAFILGDRLPVLAAPWRRLLVGPFILLATAWFSSFVAELVDGLDVGGVARGLFDGSAGGSEQAAVGALLLLGLLAGSATFYAMLIVAPRELAAPERRPAIWLVRYGVFLASAVLGAGTGALL